MSKRLQNLATPLEKFQKTAVKYIRQPFEKLTENQKFWIGFALLCLITTLLINNPFWRPTAEQYKVGDIAYEDIISPSDISVTDEEATEKLRQDARESVSPVFSYESNLAESAVQSFRSAWENMQRKSEKTGANDKDNSNSNAGINWTGGGGEEAGKVLASRRFSQKRSRFHHACFTRKFRRLYL